MNLRALALTVCLIVCGPVQASAGLTSVGVDPGQNNNAQAEPTLAQVAAQNTAAGVPTTVAGTVAPLAGNAAQQGATGTAGAAGTGPGGAAAANAAAPAPRIVVPPPPPDPATLPVSVIRPLTRTPETAAPATPAPGATASEPMPAAKAGDEGRAAAASVKPRSGLPVPSAATVSTRPSPSTAPPRADENARTTPEPEVPADGSSSSVIFYTGTGLAAAIVLLSLGAFFRGGGTDAVKPRSL